MREGAGRLFVRIRHVAMKVVMESASPKSFKIISRTSLQERTRAAVLCEFMEDTSAALYHEQPQSDVRSERYSLRSKEEAEYRWQTRRRRVLGEVGYAGLKVCHQVHHCLEMDTTAAIHGDDIIAEGEPEKMDRLDGVLRQLVEVRRARQQHGGQHKARSRVDGRSKTACCNRR